MLTKTEIYLEIFCVLIFTYLVVNAYVRKYMMKKMFTTRYRKDYFYSVHVNKHPFLYVFFTVFMLLYHKKHKDKYEYGFDLFMLEKIEDYKHTNNYSYYYLEIEDEKLIRDKIKAYERKNKLKKLNKFGRFNLIS